MRILLLYCVLALSEGFVPLSSTYHPQSHLCAVNKRRLKGYLKDRHISPSPPSSKKASSDSSKDVFSDTTSNDFLAKSIRDGVQVVNEGNAERKGEGREYLHLMEKEGREKGGDEDRKA
jgi:hypothetical protein